MTATAGYLFEGADWDFSKLQRIHDACEEIARSELGLDTYPNQIEVITAEQMLDVDVALALSAHRVPAQPVDATQALNLSAGVSNCKVSRGRSFS